MTQTTVSPPRDDAALPPHAVVWTLATSVLPSRALQLVAELGVADHIASEPVAPADLAAACGLAPDALDRLLRLLAAHGIFRVQPGGFAHSEASRLLRSDHPMSMRAFAQLMGLPVCWNSFGALEHSLRTCAPAAELAGPGGFFAYLRSHPAQARIFGQAMSAKAQADIEAVLDAYDFAPFRVIADIGGGRGHLLQAVLQTVPRAEGILFDLPDVVATVEAVASGLRTQAGDFFADPLPAADCYLLMEVIHDWPDDQALAILKAVRAAASPGANVLVIEDVIPAGAPDPRVHTLDVLMLAVTGGRERTAGQLGKLLRGARFRPSAVIETPGPLRIVEAVAV
jgi:O-methyltransferase domain